MDVDVPGPWKGHASKGLSTSMFAGRVRFGRIFNPTRLPDVAMFLPASRFAANEIHSTQLPRRGTPVRNSACVFSRRVQPPEKRQTCFQLMTNYTSKRADLVLVMFCLFVNVFFTDSLQGVRATAESPAPR